MGGLRDHVERYEEEVRADLREVFEGGRPGWCDVVREGLDGIHRGISGNRGDGRASRESRWEAQMMRCSIKNWRL
jgi:hypothetical protein